MNRRRLENNINMTNDVCIRRWNARIYDSTGKWKNGVMKLFPWKILFSHDFGITGTSDENESGGASAFEFELPFSDIRRIKKCFPALVQVIAIFTSKNEEYRFSSFENHKETFLFIEHFFLSALSAPVDNQDPSPQEETYSTTMGKELLRSVMDSKKCLAAAENQLAEQGQQLRNASVKMIETKNDLDIASRFTKGIDSCIPRIRIPRGYNHTDNFCVLNKSDALHICSVDALYCDLSPNINTSQKKSVVTTEEKGLYVMNKYQKIFQSFGWTDISRIQVVSLWEIYITQYLIGQPDRKCSFVSAHAPCLLSELHYYRPDKIEYVTPEAESSWSDYKWTVQHQAYKDAMKSEQHSLMLDEGTDNFNHLHQASQMTPSTGEMMGLSKEMTSLKSLTMDIQKLQDEQLKDIDELTIATIKESDRSSKLTKTIENNIR